MIYRPLEDRVIVKPETAEQQTKSGIFIPDTAKEKPQAGKVVAVGPGKTTEEGKTIPVPVKEGDVVIYRKYGGTELKVENEDYVILNASDILAVKVKK